MKATRNLYIAKVGFQDVPLEPGQFVFGRKIASNETGLSEQNIRTCVSTLVKSLNLTINSTNKFSVITIVNWEKYQGGEDKVTSKPTNKQPTTNQQLTTYKSIESNKKRRIYIYSEEFERFWKAHPRKSGGKEKCYIEWKKYKLDEKIEDVMSALENHIASHNWTKDNGEWITGTKKWIENNMWTVIMKPPRRQGSGSGRSKQEYQE